VVILLLDLFLILTAYYLLKVVREPLILLGGGAEVKSYASAGQAALLVVIVPAYAALASRVARMKLIDVVMGVFALSFVAFSALLESGAPIGVPFYLWLGIFNMLVIAQFWSLANELFSPAQGKRLFAIIAFGGTIGAIAGAWIAEQLIGSFGIAAIMLLAAGLLVACIVLTSVGARLARRMPRGEDVEEDAEEIAHDKPLDKNGAFKLVATQRYLRMIAIMIVLYNVVNTLGEYILGSVVTETAKAQAGGDVEVAKRLVGEFYGSFFTWVNAVAAILQALVVSRVVKYLGVRVALVLVPAFAFGSYALLAAAPVLAWIRVAKIAENGLDYSLHNTVRQMLWLPTTPEVKYKAKAAIDTFFVRAGDVIAAGLVALGGALALSSRGFAFVNLAVVLGWIGLVIIVGRLHAKALAGRKQPPEPRSTPAKPAEPAIRLPRTHGAASI
jgi:AAA family ATP:ADP antiporter